MGRDLGRAPVRRDRLDQRLSAPRSPERGPRGNGGRGGPSERREGPDGPPLGVAPGASLLVSVLFRPDFDPSELHLCTAAVALAAAEACRRWPAWDARDQVAQRPSGGGRQAGRRPGRGGFRLRASCPWSSGSGSMSTGPVPPGSGGTCLNDLSCDAGGPGGLLVAAFLDALSARRALLDSAAGTAGGGSRAAPALRHAGTTGEGRAGGRGGGGGGRRGRRRRSSGRADGSRDPTRSQRATSCTFDPGEAAISAGDGLFSDPWPGPLRADPSPSKRKMAATLSPLCAFS